MIDCSVAVKVFLKVHLEESNLNFEGYGMGSEDADIKVHFTLCILYPSSFPFIFCHPCCVVAVVEKKCVFQQIWIYVGFFLVSLVSVKSS
ncbi:hypothetical protein CEXT_440171 [Caerostris extrusa]|uniref:Uncharacterized protein n=1 Tax=Caerostris extrusa TaxID=172846 RepID=A0AAV4XBS4_CAEEX|nr:hypothetical protein CEXT_440171 [Caerostris extrusa]